MKMRNMLRGIPLLLLMASGLSVFLNCKGPISNPAPTLYTVTFDAQGGSTVAPVKAGQGKTIAKPADPVRASFTFGGWYKESACTTPWNFAADTVTANITLYAKWTPAAPATVTVMFAVSDGKGGTLTAKAGNTKLESGAKVKKDTDVTFTADPASGYEVDYWRINGEPKSGTSITVKADKDVTVTVKFKAQGAPATDFFTLTYKADPAAGGSISAKSVNGTPFESGKKIEKGTVLVFTAVPNTGYDISGWTGVTPEPDKKSAKLTVTKDISVTVTFTLKKYTVSFDAQGGAPVPAQQQIEHGKKVQKPADPAKASFTFGGWYKEKACTTPWNFATDTVTADITLFAKWTAAAPATVTVTFAVKDGHGTLTAKAGDTNLTSGASVKKGTDVIFTAAADPGYEVDFVLINGETKSGTSITVKADKDVTATVKFKAQGAPATEFFTVTYKAEPTAGGSISAKSVNGTPFESGKKIEKGTVLVFTAVPDTGYDISGWTGATPEPDNKTATLTVTGESSVTVTFTLKKYTVSFDTQGGTAVAPLEAEHGKTVQKPADPVKASFTFGGWYKENTCTTPWNFATDTVTAEITLYAQWKITIQFAPSKMTCIKNGTTVNTGATVYENDELSFTATLSTGQTVEKWTVNGEDKGGQSNPSFYYKVKTADAPDGSIEVDCAINTVAYGTIQFEPSKMTCWKDGGDDITTGTTVYENDRLYFDATPPTGQTVNKWTVNGVEKDYATQSWFSYDVRVEDVQSGVITIGYTEKPAAQAVIRFDSSRMKCWKNIDSYTNTGTPVASGSSVDENTELIFIAQPSAGKMADSWTVNGAPVKNGEGNLRWYKVGAEDSSLRFEYTEKTAEKLELRFDTSKIRCTKPLDTTLINPGMRDEGDFLIFKTTDGSAVKWKINDEYIGFGAMPVLQFPFTKESAKEFGNENLMEISYE